MSHYCNNEQCLTSINYSAYQSILITFNIKDRVTSHHICCRIDLSQLSETLPTVRWMDVLIVRTCCHLLVGQGDGFAAFEAEGEGGGAAVHCDFEEAGAAPN